MFVLLLTTKSTSSTKPFILFIKTMIHFTLHLISESIVLWNIVLHFNWGFFWGGGVRLFFSVTLWDYKLYNRTEQVSNSIRGSGFFVWKSFLSCCCRSPGWPPPPDQGGSRPGTNLVQKKARNHNEVEFVVARTSTDEILALIVFFYY